MDFSRRHKLRVKPVPLSRELPSAFNPPAGCGFHSHCPFATDQCRTKRPNLRAVGCREVVYHHAEWIAELLDVYAEDGMRHALVFPNGTGNVESYANIYNGTWVPLMEAAGLADVVGDGDQRKISPCFALHTLRHVACSLWIEQGALAKQIQTWAGHAGIQFTQDRYGHL